MHLPIAVDPAADESLQRQISRQIVALIGVGILRPSDRLPSTRVLSKQLGVARNTVLLTYRALIQEGFIETFGKSATRVCATLPRSFAFAGAQQKRVTRSQTRAEEPPSNDTLRNATLFDPWRNQLAVDFRVGRVDRTLFPIRAWRRIVDQRLGGARTGLSDYSDPQGIPELREAISTHVRLSRGISCSPDQVIVVSGVQQGLDLVARLLLERGSTVVVENPTYASAAHLFMAHGARLVGCEVTSRGLEAGALPRRGARLAYVTPSHQFPLGSTMDLETRLKLLQWAHETETFVLEDDYDSDFRYQGSPLMALAALDASERVIYLATFSKSLGAGLRLGYMIVPPYLVAKARIAKSLMDHGHSWLEQAVVADFIRSGGFRTHLRRIRLVYQERRNCLVESLKLLGESAFHGIDGGMHLSWRLPDKAATARDLQRALLAQGIGIYSLSDGPAYVVKSFEDWERIVLLGYSSVTCKKISEAFDVVGKLLRTDLSCCRAP